MIISPNNSTEPSFFQSSFDTKEAAVITIVAILAIGAAVAGGAFIGVGLFTDVINYSLIAVGGGILIIDFALVTLVHKPQKNEVEEIKEIDLNENIPSDLRATIAELKEWDRTSKDYRSLEGISQRLGNLVEGLSRDKRREYKPAINKILQLHSEIEKEIESDVDAKKISDFLALKSYTLTYFFYDTLKNQQAQVAEIRKQFEIKRHELNTEEANFIAQELNFWDTQLALEIPIAIPKYYHCTKSVNIMKKIGQTSILYKNHILPGSFVSTMPEIGIYGSFGFALSSLIETTGLIDPEEKKIRYPTISNHAFKKVWFGFQNPKGIPIKRPDIEKNPLAFYADTTIAYIFYDDRAYTIQEEQKEMEEYAQTIGVRCVSYSNLNALREIIDNAYHREIIDKPYHLYAKFPPSWKFIDNPYDAGTPPAWDGKVRLSRKKDKKRLYQSGYSSDYDQKRHNPMLDPDYLCIHSLA